MQWLTVVLKTSKTLTKCLDESSFLFFLQIKKLWFQENKWFSQQNMNAEVKSLKLRVFAAEATSYFL